MSSFSPKTLRSRAALGSVQLCLFCTTLLAFSWYYNGANANHLSRYDTMFGFVEPDHDEHLSFRIDRFVSPTKPEHHPNTGDWARNPERGEHYYSNKAPGPALLGIPIYFGLYRAESLAGRDPETPSSTYVNCYLLNVVLTALPLALSAPLFYSFLLGSGCRWGVSWFSTLALYFGTLLFPYSTQLWGHPTAAAFIVFGLYFLRSARRSASYLSGLFCALAVLNDYSAAIVVVGAVVLLAASRDRSDLAGFVAGGLPVFLVYAAYHQICFGNPLLPATRYNNPAFLTGAVAGGLFDASGLGERLWGLSFSRYRGLFWYMPVLLLAFAAPIVVRARTRRPWLWLSLAIVLASFLMNVFFSGWHGGAAAGPRYLIPSLPFYGVLIAFSLDAAVARWAGRPRAARIGYSVVLLLAAVSASNMLVLTAVSPMAEPLREEMSAVERSAWADPLGFYYEGLPRGFVEPFRLFAVRGVRETPRERARRTFSVGAAVGLEGKWQIVPLAMLILGGVGAGTVLGARRRDPDGSVSDR